MFRLISLLIAVVIIGAGFAALADYPANMALTLPGWRIAFTPAAAAAVIILAVLAILLAVYLIRLILSPLGWGAAWRLHKKAAAYKNLALGLMAAYAGDIMQARAKADEAKPALPVAKEPLTALLMAEIHRAEMEQAEFFAPLCEKPQTPAAERDFLPLLRKQFLADGGKAGGGHESEAGRTIRLPVLRALYEAAKQAGSAADAARFAAVAASEQPALIWASLGAISAAAAKGDWQSAAELYDRWREAWRKPIKQDETGRLERAFDYYRQCLLCGQAMAVFPRQPRQGRDLALEAHKLNPLFAPAAVLAAEILFQQSETRRAEKLALAAWTQKPHPDLANVFISGGGLIKDAGDRLKRAEALTRVSPNSALAHRAAAEAAFAARDYAIARTHAEKAKAGEPSAELFILLAKIAERQNKRSEIGEFLLSALSAEPDKIWMADGQRLKVWQALSPETHRLGAALWQRPSAPAFTPADMQKLAEELHLQDLPETVKSETAGAASGEVSADIKEEISAPPLHGFAPPEPPEAAKGETGNDGKNESAPQTPAVMDDAVLPDAAVPIPPLHGYAPPESAAETSGETAAPTRLNVDNPGVEK